MANGNVYNWEFPLLRVYLNQESQQDVVYGVQWKLTATDPTATYSASLQGSQKITPYVSGSSFVPFAELTKPLVQGWLLDALGTASYDIITSKLDAAVEISGQPPTSVVLPPPWV